MRFPRADFNFFRKSILERKWLQEVLVFSTVFILFTLNEWKDITKWDDVWRTGCYFLILYVHAQLHRFLILPLLLEKQKPLQYATAGVTMWLTFSVLLHFASGFIYPDCPVPFPGMLAFLSSMGTTGLSLIAILTPFIVLRFYNQQKQHDESQLCMREMELSLLRSQLNPHFLFNTFNNLYGISLHEPERLPDLILQTSKLMRYQLNDKLWVPLQDELVFTESFLALEEERVCNRCELKYDYQKSSEEGRYMIASMMLMPFIENAFKHGTDCMMASYIHIKIVLDNGWLRMNIRNSIASKSVKRDVPSTGIGLENVRQRLEILYPGKKHQLTVNSTPSEYNVTLALKLTSVEEYEAEVQMFDRR